MNEIVVKTLDGKSIEFVGQMISQAEGRVESTDGIERTFALKLYAISDDGFVPAIEYRSTDESERTGCIAEQVDTVDDVEKCFSVFEPTEVLPKFPRMTREETEFRKQLTQRLSASYDKLVSEVLDELDRIVKQHPITDEPANTVKEKSNGFWNLLRGNS